MAETTIVARRRAASFGEVPLWVRVVVPVALGIVFLGLWEFLVWRLQIPKFVLPAPSLIGKSLIEDLPTLLPSLWNTLQVTISAFVVALVLGVAFAILFSQSVVFEI